MTLTVRLLALIALALLPPLLVGAWGGWEARRDREAALRVAALDHTRAASADVSRLAEGVRRLLAALAAVPAIREGDAPACTAYLREVAAGFRDFALLGANAADGAIICTSAGAAPGEYSNAARAYHQRAMASGGFAAGDLVTGVTTRRRSIHFALPFQRPDGTVGGIVLASVDQAALARQLAAAALPPGAIAVVVDPSGTVVAGHADGAEVAAGWVGAPLPAPLRAALTAGSTRTVSAEGPDGRRRLFGALPADPSLGGIVAVVGLDEARSLADLRAAAWRNTLGLALGAVMALAAGGYWARRFVVAPLRRLTSAAGRVGEGEFGARSNLRRGGGVMRDLGVAFDRMSDALRDREAERDRAAEAQALGEARLARLLALSPAGIVELGADGRIAFANPAAERLLGAGPGALAGMRHDDPAWAAADRDGAPFAAGAHPIARALRGEVVRGFEHGGATLDGRRVVLVVDVVPVREPAAGARPEGAVTGALAAFQDVTARDESMRALRSGEERYRTLFEAIDTGFCIIHTRHDAAGRCVDYQFDEVNPAFARQTGLPDAEGRWMRDIAADQEERWFEIYGRVATTGERVRFEERAAALGRWFDVEAFKIGAPEERRIGVLFNDITARREAEESVRRLNAELEARVAERTAELMAAEETLRQSQKMEAVGQLTGGIAHDFNNMLQGIGGAVEMARRRMEAGRTPEAPRYLDAARTAVERAAALTNRLLAFARRQALQPRAVDPDALVRGMEEMLRRTVGPQVSLDLDLRDGTWSVLCDPSGLESGLLNLAINARDAMPGGGRLRVETRHVVLSEAEVAGQEGGRPGPHVEIAARDTGEGMDEATRARAFEPFFTTKPLGKGTGLGLSQIYGFVRQTGGSIRIESVPGHGTAVRLFLPRHGAPAEEMPAPTPAALGGAGESVLLVDDEDAVRGVAAERLRELGYRVTEAADGPAALRALESGAAPDVLVTDVGLPGGLNGRQLADAARERHPDLPVLFITGYAGSALEGGLDPGMAVIGKPFALDALAARVATMLRA